MGPHPVVVPDARRHVGGGARLRQAAEAKLGVGGVLLALPDVLWVNRPDLAATAVYRPVQWAAAARCGLTVPRTLVSNDPAAVSRFAQVSVPGVVLKPSSANLIYEDHTYKMGWTRKLSADDLADLRGVEVTAHLVQDWAPKCWECRAVVVGEDIFAVAIYAGSDESYVDWRSVIRRCRMKSLNCQNRSPPVSERSWPNWGWCTVLSILLSARTATTRSYRFWRSTPGVNTVSWRLQPVSRLPTVWFDYWQKECAHDRHRARVRVAASRPPLGR